MTDRTDPTFAPPTSGLLGAALVLAGALAYLGLLRGYGFQVEDEGLILFQFDRVWRGQIPYVDFHTGYTPGLYYGAMAAFAALGRSVLAIRTALLVLNATSAAFLYLVARRLVGPWMALVPPLLWLVFVPVYPGEFAAFNVPYPTWPATVLWGALALLLLRWVRRDGVAGLVGAGLTAAGILAVRPNSGAFAIAAATWVVVAFARRATALDRAAAVAASAFMAVGVWIVFDRRLVGTDAVVHVWPMLALAVGCVGPFARAPVAGSRTRTLPALAIMGVVFVVPTAAWMLRFLAFLGPDVFLREVLLIGSQYAVLYYRPHPTPELYAVVVVTGVVVLAGTGWLVARDRVRPAPLLGAGLVAVVLAGVVVARVAVMPEGIRDSLFFQAENALFWLVPLAHFGALAALARAARARRDDAATRALTVVTVLGVATYLQMYPRSDFMHQITAVPLALVVGTALAARVLGWWGAGRWPASGDGRRVVGGIAAVAIGAIVATRLSLVLPGALAAEARGPGVAGMPVAVESGADDDLTALRAAGAYVAEHTQPGEPVFAFPATIAVLFAADRPSPVRHDYWFPGRPDHEEEAKVVASLQAAPPRYIVTFNRGWTFFSGAPAYFTTLREFVTARYRLAARFGRYDVLAARGVVGDAPPTIVQPTGPLADVIEPRLARRRQAARRWMAGLTPADAAAATLPADPRDAVLLLRGVRDGGDLRAAGWVIAGYRSDAARVRREALNDMPHLVEELGARLRRWADDETPPDAAPFVAPYVDAARGMLGDPAAASFARALLDVAGASADPPAR